MQAVGCEDGRDGTPGDEQPVCDPGNVRVRFLALSYDGTLTITLIGDPDALPDLPGVAADLEVQLDALISAPAAGRA